MDPNPIKFKSPFKYMIDNPRKFDELRELLRNQKVMLTILQPNKRSFSNPELHDGTSGEFHSFRKFLLQNKITNIRDNSPNDCQSKCDENIDSQRPTPIPRKSRHKKPNDKNSNVTTTTSTNINSKDGNSKSFPNISNLSYKNKNLINEPILMLTSKSSSSEAIDINNSTSLITKSVEPMVKLPPMPTIKTPIKIKNKNSFRSFLKINKIRTNKFLSLRHNNNQNGNNRKSLFEFNNGSPEEYKPRRPTRDPPPPPILVFRPAAPLPEEESDEENQILSNPIQIDLNNDTISELYHDAVNLYDGEGIYCSVDDVRASSNETNDEKNDYPTEQNHSNSNNFLSHNEYGIYDDGLCIYEELSSKEGTIYEEYGENEDIIYDNAEFVEINLTNDKKYLKQLKKKEKMMKKFKLTGEEIPVNAGIVKKSCKGSKNNLFVSQGETVLILRMENNPPGKWLAKNERSKIGYINLDNVLLETDSIKAAFKSFNSI